MQQADDSISGALADRYRLERELGTGGSATVYLAQDLRHRRQVAVKVLHRDLARTFGPERFQREIETTANLRHPHILPLFDSGEVAGTMYYVMPLVVGESLRALIDRTGQFETNTALRLIGDVADALSHAHDQGIIHRDIKPENILIEHGRAVVADFGIACASSAEGLERLTNTGMSLGTPLYMSPEQAFGEASIDARSDQYSLSCVLYEMLAGQPPFVGSNAMAILMKHLQHPAPALRDTRPDVPEHIGIAIQRALAKSAGQRFPSIREYVDALTSATPAVESNVRRGTTRAGTLAPDTHQATLSTGPTRVAVLPFTNMSADPDTAFFGDGMAEDILNELAKLSGLRVIPRTSSFALKGERVDVAGIASRLGARYVLDGSVRKSGQRLRITVQLIDAERGDTIWSERYDREMTDVFAVQDEITGAVRDALSERLLGISVPAVRSDPGIDPETYELYLRGKYIVTRRLEDPRRGIEILEEVIRRAPQYAPALVQLAIAHKMRVIYGTATPSDGWPIVRQRCEQAVDADPNDAKAFHNLADTAFYWEWDWKKAQALFDRAIELDPREADALASYAMFKCSTRDFETAVDCAERVVGLDPLNPTVHLRAAITQYLARRHDAAMASCDRMIELAPEFAEAYRWKGLSLLDLGRPEEAAVETARAIALSGRNQWAVFDHGLALAACGRVDEARELARELEERSRTEPLSPYVRTLAHQLEEPQNLTRVFELFEHGLGERMFWLVMFDVEPTADWLRDDPRFDAMLRKVGIPNR